jgi:predicted ATPase
LTFKWEHNRIQEAALLLIGKDELPSIQFEVDELLVSTLSKHQVNESLFVLANILNQGPMRKKSAPSMSMRLVVNLNLQTGLNAFESSAFVAATSYLTRGVELLPIYKWTSNYKLAEP